MGIEAAIFTSLLLGAFGTATQMRQGRKAEKFARSQQEQLERATRERDTRVREGTANVNAAFGVGDENQGSRSRIMQAIDAYENAVAQQGLAGADALFQDQSQQNRFALARSGLTGSGADRNVRRRTVADFLRNQQGAIGQAANSRAGIENQLESQRRGLLNELSQGTFFTPSEARRSLSSVLGNTRTNVPSSAIGTAFSDAGRVTTLGAQAEGLGYGGFGGLFDRDDKEA